MIPLSMLRDVKNLEKRIAATMHKDSLAVNQIPAGSPLIKTNVIYGSIAQLFKGWRAFKDAYLLDRTGDREMRQAFYRFAEILPSLDGYNASKLAYVLDIACHSAARHTIQGPAGPQKDIRIRNSIKSLTYELNNAMSSPDPVRIARINKATVKAIRYFSNTPKFIETILSAIDSPYKQ
jgi:hypothetical protein